MSILNPYMSKDGKLAQLTKFDQLGVLKLSPEEGAINFD